MEQKCSSCPNHCCSQNSVQKEEFLEMFTRRFVSWLEWVYPKSTVERHIKVDKENNRIIAKIWTSVNEYTVIAKYSKEDLEPGGSMPAKFGSLGCQASSRKPRPGETWTRGRDLRDGKFCLDTWLDILIDIVHFEAEEIKSDAWKEEYDQEKSSK